MHPRQVAHPVAQKHPRSHARAAGLLAAILLTGLVAACSSGVSEDDSSGNGDSSGAGASGDIDVTEVTAIELDQPPVHVAVGEGAVWISGSGSSGVVRIDPSTNEVVADIDDRDLDFDVDFSLSSGDIAVGEGAVWVNGDDGIARIDPSTNEIVDVVEFDAGGPLAVGGGAVWAVDDVFDPDAQPAIQPVLVRIDPSTNEAETFAEIDGDISALTYGGDAIWVFAVERESDDDEAQLIEVNPSNGSIVTTVDLPGEFFGSQQFVELAYGFDAVWITYQNEAEVIRVDADSGDVSTIDLDQNPMAVATGFGSVWVSLSGSGLARIDPDSSEVADVSTRGQTADGIAAGEGAVWLIHETYDEVTRIG